MLAFAAPKDATPQISRRKLLPIATKPQIHESFRKFSKFFRYTVCLAEQLHTLYRTSNLGFPFWVLSHSFGSGTESLGSRLHRIHHNIHAISHLLEKHPVQWVTLYKVYCKSSNNLGTTKNNYNPQRCLVWSKI